MENVWESWLIKIDFGRPYVKIGRRMADGRLLFLALCYSARLLSTTPAVNYGRFMAFVTNVLILEPIVY